MENKHFNVKRMIKLFDLAALDTGAFDTLCATEEDADLRPIYLYNLNYVTFVNRL